MVKTAVLGAAGGIGQPLSLLLTTLPGITALNLYDIVLAKGVAADLSHCNAGVKVKGYVGPAELDAALTGVEVVVIPAGVPRKPGMTRDDLFKVNAGIVRDLALAVAKNCPKAMVCIISNPVNSTVPIFAEVMRKQGCFDPRRIFGVTTLDSVRAATFVSSLVPSIAPHTQITVLGGHSGHTIVPIFSRVEHNLSHDQLSALVHRVQFGGDEVVQAKEGAGSATLSMAYAARRFVESVIKGMQGREVIEAAYIFLDPELRNVDAIRTRVDGCQYFAVNVRLGKDGIQEVLDYAPVTEYEQELIDKAIPELKQSVAKSVEFISSSKL